MTRHERERFLWRIYALTRIPEARDALLALYGPLVDAAAAALHKRTGARLDDLHAAGVEGLWQAIESFDVNAEVRFRTFSLRRIRGAMLDFLRRSGPFSRTRYRQARRHAQAAEAIRSALCREVSDDEVPQGLPLPVITSIERPEDDAAGILDDIPSSETAPFARAVRAEFWQTLLAPFNDRDARIVELYYREGLTMKEIAETEGLSESRVSQIISRITLDLAGKKEQIRDFLNLV